MELEVALANDGFDIMTTSERIAQRHIKLDHIGPAIWRGLDDIIQAVMQSP